MKIRTGFVSNSSSSSYVIITTQKSYVKVLKQLSDIERIAVNAEFRFKPETVFSEERLVMSTVFSTEDCGEDWGIEADQIEEAIDGIYKFFSLISKEKDTFAKNFDC